MKSYHDDDSCTLAVVWLLLLLMMMENPSLPMNGKISSRDTPGSWSLRRYLDRTHSPKSTWSIIFSLTVYRGIATHAFELPTQMRLTYMTIGNGPRISRKPAFQIHQKRKVNMTKKSCKFATFQNACFMIQKTLNI